MDCSYLAGAVFQVAHNLADRIRCRLGVVHILALKVYHILPVLENLLGLDGLVDREAVTSSALPAGAAAPTAAYLIEVASRVGADVAAESQNEGRNVVGLECLNHLLGHDGAGHGSASVGSNGVDVDIVLGTLAGQSTGETEDTTFLILLAGTLRREIKRHLRQQHSWPGQSYHRHHW